MRALRWSQDPPDTVDPSDPVECDRRGQTSSWSATAERHQPKGLSLMPEAVIVDAVRTPVGRAFKGSLATLRPDETLAFIIDQLLERNPGVDPAQRRGGRRGLRPAAGPAGQQHRPARRPPERQARPGDQRLDDQPVLRLGPRRDPHRGQRRRRRAGRRVHRRRRRVRVALQRGAGSRPPGGPEREAAGQGARPAERLHRDGPDGRERRAEATASPASSRTSSPSARRTAPSRPRSPGSSIARSSRSRWPTEPS